MGLRCTLLGHAWSDPQIEREREESDAEVVTTVREFKTCDRCGSRSVVSENVEVTAQESAGGAESGEADAETGPVIEDAETGGRTVVDPDAGGDEADTDTDDGAVILGDDTAGADDREYGEWPEADDAAPEREDDPGSWPVHDDEGTVRYDPDASDEADDPGADAEASGSAADAAASPADGADTGDGPDATSGSRDPAEADEASDEGVTVADGEEDEVELLGSGPDGSDEDAGGAGSGRDGRSDHAGAGSRDGDDGDAGGAVDPADALSAAAEDQQTGSEEVDPTMAADVETEVYCPECGFVGEDASPSLRGGDSCPNCRRAYLEEREV